jgi:hypothetical protein
MDKEQHIEFEYLFKNVKEAKGTFVDKALREIQEGGSEMPREATEKLLEMVEEGLLDRDTVIMACVKYMSEDDVADMCHINEFFYDPDEDEEE